MQSKIYVSFAVILSVFWVFMFIGFNNSPAVHIILILIAGLLIMTFIKRNKDNISE